MKPRVRRPRHRKTVKERDAAKRRHASRLKELTKSQDLVEFLKNYKREQ